MRTHIGRKGGSEEDALRPHPLEGGQSEAEGQQGAGSLGVKQPRHPRGRPVHWAALIWWQPPLAPLRTALRVSLDVGCEEGGSLSSLA